MGELALKLSAQSSSKIARHNLVGICLTVLFAMPVSAQVVFEVNSTVDAADAVPGDGLCSSADGECTIRAAFDEANEATSAVVVNVPAGTFRIESSLFSHGSEVRVVGSGQNATTLESDSNATIISSGASRLHLESMTLEGVTVAALGSLLLADVRIFGVAGVNAVATSVQGHLTLQRCLIELNTVAMGVLLSSMGTIILEDSAVRNNNGNAFSKNLGGSWQIIRSEISGNSGWGLFASNDVGAFVESSTIHTNGAGGIFMSWSTNLELLDSTVRDNLGPGIQLGMMSYLTIRNTTISSNQGGGLLLPRTQLSRAIIESSTIVRNRSDQIGAGIRIDEPELGFTRPARIEIQNSLIAENVSPLGGGDCYVHPAATGSTSGGHNLVGNAEGCEVMWMTTDLLGTAALPIDPLIGPLSENGGSTSTHALLGGSPALDSGSPESPGSSATACPSADQRGIARPLDGTRDGIERCDIGAFEYEPPCTLLPVATCSVPGFASLKLRRNERNEERNVLKVSMKKADIPFDVLGDPLADSDTYVCIYDDGLLAHEHVIPSNNASGIDLWTTLGRSEDERGYRYLDRSLQFNGNHKALLRGNKQTLRASVEGELRIRAKPDALWLPGPVDSGGGSARDRGAHFLGPVVVQSRGSTQGECMSFALELDGSPGERNRAGLYGDRCSSVDASGRVPDCRGLPTP